jgi:hypothetical protein
LNNLSATRKSQVAFITMTIKSQPFIVWIHTNPETIKVVHASFSTEASVQVSRLGNERAGRTIIAAESHYSPIYLVVLAYPRLKEKYPNWNIEQSEIDIWQDCYPGKSLKEVVDEILRENSKLIAGDPSIVQRLGMPRMLKEAQEFLSSVSLQIC